ncbi:MAG: PAS domain-containing protein [bacterium]
MRAKLSTFALVTALLYIAAVIVLLVAISSGMNSPHAVGALGAALAAGAAVIGLFAGYRTAGPPDHSRVEERAAAEAARSGAFDTTPPRTLEPPAPVVTPAPAAPPLAVAPGPRSREAAATAILLREQIDAIPIGFATLDRDLIIRAANPALEQLLHVSERGSLVGVALAKTVLGAAIYSGESARLVGLPLAEFAATALGRTEPLEVTRLLVPGNGHGWVAQLSARLQSWPPAEDEPECLYLWVQPEATFRVIRETRSDRNDRPDVDARDAATDAMAHDAHETHPAANDAATIASLDDTGDVDPAAKLHEIGVRLRLIATTARALRATLRDPNETAAIAENDLRTLAELMMIEIQADRIGQSLGLFRVVSPSAAPPPANTA